MVPFTTGSYALLWARHPDTGMLVSAGKTARGRLEESHVGAGASPEEAPEAAADLVGCSSSYFATCTTPSMLAEQG